MIEDLNTVKKKKEQDFINEVVEIKLKNVELIDQLEIKENQEEKWRMQIEAYKDEVKRLEEDLKKSNIKITEYSTEMIVLK